MLEVLILYYSRYGAVAKLAEEMASSVNSVAGVSAKVRTVPPVVVDVQGADDQRAGDSVPDQGPLYCELEDLRACDGLLLGSPTRFGNMAAPLKHFLDSTSTLWVSGDLIGKPASVFTSTSSLHGGNESTLLTMMVPLLHHGMLLQGIPYSEAALHSTRSGGGPYGATHVSFGDSAPALTTEEIAAARAAGERMARLVKALAK